MVDGSTVITGMETIEIRGLNDEPLAEFTSAAVPRAGEFVVVKGRSFRVHEVVWNLKLLRRTVTVWVESKE